MTSAKEVLAQDETVVLLDCREPHEYELVHLPNSLLLPTSVFLQEAHRLQAVRERRILVLCHHGVRSLGVTQWLREQGFPQVQSVSGGIDAWAREIDPSLPRY